MLDKIAANRLKKVAMDELLLSKTQYGRPGDSTSHAVQDIVEFVHKAWSRKMRRKLGRKLTIMGLDMAGAFDRVNRERLLQALADKGIPEWFLRLMQSFLSHRITTLRLPQSTSGHFSVNTGVPQGSPLSPLLFLFFATPLLEHIQTQEVPLMDIRLFVYVDDIYLVVGSRSYEQNCHGLKILHDKIMEWSDAAGVEFSPHKYKIMHFKDPRDGGPDCELLPDIEGLKDNPECLERESLLVLGVCLDPQLTWDPHISHIEEKVEKSLRYLRSITGPTWGMSLKNTRRYYLSKIRPTIAYAYSAWFIHIPGKSLRRALKLDQIERLEKLEYKCLKLVSGCLGNTSRAVLEKELGIHGIRNFLYTSMLVSRASAMRPVLGEKSSLKVTSRGFPGKGSAFRATVHDHLNKEAEALALRTAKYQPAPSKGQPMNEESWLNTNKRKAAIKQQALREATQRSSESWNIYRLERATRHRSVHYPQAMEENWDLGLLEYYDGMKRGESTLLLQMRSEFIGLNGFLNNIRATRPVPNTSATPTASSNPTTISELVAASCPCGHSKQTVFHLFMNCRDLHAARSQLRKAMGTKQIVWPQLLTTHAKVVTEWAMVHFKLDQFNLVRQDSRFST
ncbi:hypothetical protein FGRMN_6632 [Fusarium graminum]|nr:hypothetical protein FGRMN_6632 [Fusarium graminum]